jgi:hypothetical protein
MQISVDLFPNILTYFREVIEKESLRAYLAIIYAYPRMKVYIRDKKV